MTLCLTTDELRELTGYQKPSAQIRWLRQQGFIVLKRADGMPIISRAHFEKMTGGTHSPAKPTTTEPDFNAFI